jgi:tRNA(Arg) A34 adenosine deaminase TadA
MTMTVMNNSCSCASVARNISKVAKPEGTSLNLPFWQASNALQDQPAADHHFWPSQDVQWMQGALALALQGSELGEVPVGAILVHEGQIIGQGFNQPITQSDPTCHAEIVALRAACQQLENYRLPLGTTLYVTLEPCTMCIGALIHARLHRLVYATREPRAGMLGSQLDLSSQDFYNHKITVHGGLLAEQSSQMLKAFFKQRRARKK